MGVEESKAGTMLGTDGQAKVAPSEKGKTPVDVSKVSPEETPKFTQKEHDSVIHAVKSEVGRRETAVEAREQAIKAAEIKAEEKRKEKEVQELADATPDERPLIQRRQALRVKELAAEEKDRELTAREATNKAEIDAARDTKLETVVFDIATKHGVDAVWLKALAKRYNISDAEELEKEAKGASTQKRSEPVTSRTMGGGVDWRNLSPSEKVRIGLNKP